MKSLIRLFCRWCDGSYWIVKCDHCPSSKRRSCAATSTCGWLWATWAMATGSWCTRSSWTWTGSPSPSGWRSWPSCWRRRRGCQLMVRLLPKLLFFQLWGRCSMWPKEILWHLSLLMQIVVTFYLRFWNQLKWKLRCKGEIYVIVSADSFVWNYISETETKYFVLKNYTTLLNVHCTHCEYEVINNTQPEL